VRVLVCAVIIGCPGCSAIGTRITDGGYFSGVRGDFDMVFRRASIDPDSRVSPVLAVADSPFSLVADILFLPYDAYSECQSSRSTNTVGPPSEK
jgi:uncharacterized protein YceK